MAAMQLVPDMAHALALTGVGYRAPHRLHVDVAEAPAGPITATVVGPYVDETPGNVDVGACLDHDGTMLKLSLATFKQWCPACDTAVEYVDRLVDLGAAVTFSKARDGSGVVPLTAIGGPEGDNTDTVVTRFGSEQRPSTELVVQMKNGRWWGCDKATAVKLHEQGHLPGLTADDAKLLIDGAWQFSDDDDLDGPSGAVIVMLPAEPADIEYADGDKAPAHQTLAYLGAFYDLEDVEEAAIDRVIDEIANTIPPFTARVSGRATLGDDGDEVAITEAHELQQAHDLCVRDAYVGPLYKEHAYPTWISHITGVDSAAR